MAGDGPLKAQLQALANGYGLGDRLSWLGWVGSMGSLYREVDVFVHPSEGEGFSNAVLEAMAHGLPVVARDAAFNHELIEHEVTGLLFDGSPEALFQAVGRLCRDHEARKTLGKAARQFVRDHHSWDVVHRAYLALVQRACGTLGPSSRERL